MKQKNKYFNTALFDADTVIWLSTNGNKILKNGIPQKDSEGRFLYTPKTLEEATKTADSYISDVLHLTQADSYILFLTTGETFRHKLDNSYKAGRTKEKPLWFNEVKEHLVGHWGAAQKDGLEADDMVAISYANLANSFIISGDKDLLYNIPGTHFKTYKGVAEWITISYSEAEYNFSLQMLTGDTADSVANLQVGWGPVKAKAELDRRLDLQLVTPLSAAFNIFVRVLGEYEGIRRFAHQYKLLKMIESFDQLPEGVEFTIPEPRCWDCVETLLSDNFYQIEYYETGEIS